MAPKKIAERTAAEGFSRRELKPKLSDFVDLHRIPLGSAVRMGRRNLFAGRRNGSRAAQISTESPGRERPTTETADAAGKVSVD